jgi:diaminopimelate epimerase
MSILFTKMQGLGNDFVLIDDLRVPGLGTPIDADLAARLCDRRLGVGADQLLWLKRPKATKGAPGAPEAGDPSAPQPADARMEIFNADGSVAEMCGNGIRAAALYLHDHRPNPRPVYAIETLAGIKRVEVDVGTRTVRVDMGPPRLGAGFGPQRGAPAKTQQAHQPGESLESVEIGGKKLGFFEVDMGNPHAVLFVDDVARSEIETTGPMLETHPRFPQRTNVEVVQVLSEREIRVRVWERGVGLTLACGTGACAAAVAALATGRVKGPVEVLLPGGSLTIEWDGRLESPVFMEGPAQEVFRGQWLL